MPVLELTQIHKRFGDTVALDGANLVLEEGQVHALVGENGAGKSTLMGILAGTLSADGGSILVDGETYAPTSPREARRRGISLVHQEPSLCPDLTVSQNIVLGDESAHRGWLDREREGRRVEEALRLFNHPEIRPDKKVGELSLSARQIVDICRALSCPARIVLMDEPTSALQRSDVARLFELIRGLSAQRKSVIYISHFLEEIREIANWCTVLRDGQDVHQGPLDKIGDDDLIAKMVGRSVQELFPPRIDPSPSPAATLLAARNLTAPPELIDADLNLKSGEILGIAGLAGSGRTRLVRGLLGLQPFDSGSLRLGQIDLDTTRLSPSRQIGFGLGYLSEDRKGEGLALAMSIADNVTMTGFESVSRWGWLNLARQGAHASRAAEPLQIKARSVWQPVSALSGGNQQKVAIARLFHQDGEILLLDEPTRGVDIGSKAHIYRAIAGLAAAGKGVLLVSSYLPELFGLCHRLAVMSRGRLSETRPVQDWTPESVLGTALGVLGQA